MSKIRKASWLPKLAWGGCLLAVAQLAGAESLKEAVDQTVKSNPDVLVDVQQRLAQEHQVTQAKAGYYPKVDMALGIGREGSENISTQPGDKTLWRRESSLTLSQMLFDGYAVKSDVDRSEARLQAAAHKVNATSEQIGLRAVEVYLEVLRRQELLALTQENLTAHEKTYQQIKLRADTGIGRKADLEQAESRLSLAQSNLSSAQANLREAEINYQRVVGKMPDGLVKPEDVPCELCPPTLDNTIDTAYANHPALRSAIAEYDAALAQQRGADAPFKPRLNLDLETSRNRNLAGVEYRDNDAYAMLRMQYNLFHGGVDSARVRETEYLSQASQAAVERTKRQIEEDTRMSWSALETAKGRIPLLKDRVDASTMTRDAYIKQFSVGQRTLVDLLDAENELYSARSDYVNGLYTERFARYRLMADMGKLLDTLGVAPREEARIGDEGR
ncbi:outer membrane protein, adhesin transport system [Novimethylophilus kurashikiensis]|uniref:Outer membrane protein, adhesin transport system n=1 Tax=Novimethylophilus kurashikiensis TaxID=1825523 RepID=A0A2R5F314_9PROT|nr:TolC family outer membrane protein [Novimethylophilus kurashikiensis]GBG12937.1 outer membrane protein, adhesin transport system [Novimethylophilus kurashikiensis]